MPSWPLTLGSRPPQREPVAAASYSQLYQPLPTTGYSTISQRRAVAKRLGVTDTGHARLPTEQPALSPQMAQLYANSPYIKRHAPHVPSVPRQNYAMPPRISSPPSSLPYYLPSPMPMTMAASPYASPVYHYALPPMPSPYASMYAPPYPMYYPPPQYAVPRAPVEHHSPPSGYFASPKFIRQRSFPSPPMSPDLLPKAPGKLYTEIQKSKQTTQTTKMKPKVPSKEAVNTTTASPTKSSPTKTTTQTSTTKANPTPTSTTVNASKTKPASTLEEKKVQARARLSGTSVTTSKPTSLSTTKAKPKEPSKPETPKNLYKYVLGVHSESITKLKDVAKTAAISQELLVEIKRRSSDIKEKQSESLEDLSGGTATSTTALSSAKPKGSLAEKKKMDDDEKMERPKLKRPVTAAVPKKSVTRTVSSAEISPQASPKVTPNRIKEETKRKVTTPPSPSLNRPKAKEVKKLVEPKTPPKPVVEEEKKVVDKNKERKLKVTTKPKTPAETPVEKQAPSKLSPTDPEDAPLPALKPSKTTIPSRPSTAAMHTCEHCGRQFTTEDNRHLKHEKVCAKHMKKDKQRQAKIQAAEKKKEKEAKMREKNEPDVKQSDWRRKHSKLLFGFAWILIWCITHIS